MKKKKPKACKRSDKKIVYKCDVDMLSPLFVSLFADLCLAAGKNILEKKKISGKIRIIIQEV